MSKVGLRARAIKSYQPAALARTAAIAIEWRTRIFIITAF